jgi:hypothetical protein
LSFAHQRLTWWCGLAAASNALELIGIHRDQEELATLCHVTKKHGTDEHEVMRALMACGAKVSPWSSRRKKLSMQWLQSSLLNTGPVILAVSDEQHWVTVIGSLTQTTFLVFDPATGEGLGHYHWDEIAAWWRVSNHRGGPSYYGIAVSQ